MRIGEAHSVEENGVRVCRHKYEAKLIPKILARNKEFKKSVPAELARLGDTVPLVPLIKEYLGGISHVHEQLPRLSKMA
jgi:hypothetical protein